MSDRAFYNDPLPACPGCRQRDQQIAELKAEIVRLNDRLDRQEKEISELKAALEEFRRAAKRQAAPFSKGAPKEKPKVPGRKSGADYGQHTRRDIPDRIDEIHAVPLPERCPFCGGSHLDPLSVQAQYQAEIPAQPIYRRFDVAVGCCRDCGRQVRGRHPLQTSDAVGAAASQLGPRAQAAVVLLNKELGLSHGKVARFFDALLGMELSRAGSCRIMLRSAQRLEEDYQAIVQSVQQSQVVVPDETGWRVGGHGAWLHVAVGDLAVGYLIDKQRGIEAITKLLGPRFDGTLVHDGFASYDQFTRATHQTCLGHLIRRCRQMMETAKGMARRFPGQVKGLLQRALGIRDQRDAGELSPEQAVEEADRLQREMTALLRPAKTNPDNRRLGKHVGKRDAQLFTFLRKEGVDATNHKAEQAIRPAVVNRKVWGGNRTWVGAKAQSILMSVLGTCRKRGRNTMDYLSSILARAPVEPLLPAPPSD